MGLLSTHSQAQKVVVEDKEPNSVMFVTIDKAGNEIIRIMNASQSPRFHEPKAPRFLLTDRKGKFALVSEDMKLVLNMILAVFPIISTFTRH